MENCNKAFLSKLNNIAFAHTVVLFFMIHTVAPVFAQKTDTQQEKELHLEKVYLHLDKSFYTAGEDIWFKAYLLDGRSHTPNTLSELVYVELISPDNLIISKKPLKATNGSAAGVFKLPPKATAGTYTIRAYTNYMRNFGISNFFTKEILVNTADSPVVLNGSSLY